MNRAVIPVPACFITSVTTLSAAIHASGKSQPQPNQTQKMKTIKHLLFNTLFPLGIGIIAGLGVIELAGCASTTPQVTTAPVVYSLPVTNPATGTVAIVTQTNLVTTTNLVYSPNTNEINAYVQAAQGIIATSAPVNPYAGLMTILAGALGTIVTIGSGVYAYIKNGQANTSAAVSSTMVQAIESLPATIAPAVKAQVATRAQQAGTSAAVDKVVQAQT